MQFPPRPKHVPPKVKNLRMKCMGVGLRVRECCFCKRSSSDTDPVVSECYLLWAHMEADAVTIQGSSCMWCNQILRGRFKGWKQGDLQNAIAKDPKQRALFDNLLQMIIDEAKKGSWAALSKVSGTPNEQLIQQAGMQEKVHLTGSLLYPKEAFMEEFKFDPDEAGMKPTSIPLPGGQCAGPGYKVEDHGRRPLPPGVIFIERSFVKTGMLQATVDDSSTAMDDAQVRDNFAHHVSTRFAEEQLPSASALAELAQKANERAASAQVSPLASQGQPGLGKPDAEVDPEALADSRLNDWFQTVDASPALKPAPRPAPAKQAPAAAAVAPARIAPSASPSAAAGPTASVVAATASGAGKKRKASLPATPSAADREARTAASPEDGAVQDAEPPKKAKAAADLLQAMDALSGEKSSSKEADSDQASTTAASQVGAPTGKMSKKIESMLTGIKNEWSKTLERFGKDDIKAEELQKLCTQPS